MKINLGLIPNNAVVAVALSGGRDSMALLHKLMAEKINVKAICVEHGIRGEVSKTECDEVKKYCDGIKVVCKTYCVDAISYAKQNKLTVEQSARELRYACFEDALDGGFCDYVATAHHADDNAETVLMRIFRGTGAKGLIGISDKRDRYIRPLLASTREEIDEYVKIKNITYFEDETNAQLDYTRNFIRHEIMEKIKTRYPSAVKSISRLSSSISRDEEYFDTVVSEKIVSLDGAWGIDIKDLSIPAVSERLIRRAFYNLGVLVDVEERHVDLVKSLASAENGTTLDMPYDTVCAKEYDRIVVYKKSKPIDYEVELDGFDKCYSCAGVSVLVKSAKRRGKGLFVDYDKIKGAVFRPKRNGDIFKRYGGGTKSLGDYLTDIKLPLRLRDGLIVLAKDNDVYAIVGVEISDKAKIDKNTERIVEIRCEE